jgi:hypothetical protein
MVPDVFQIIVKEKGVFTNVTSPSTKAKLRILFEVAPLALMVEQVRNHQALLCSSISHAIAMQCLLRLTMDRMFVPRQSPSRQFIPAGFMVARSRL